MNETPSMRYSERLRLSLNLGSLDTRRFLAPCRRNAVVATAVCAALLQFAHAADTTPQAVWNCYYAGKQYQFQITAAQLERAPKWDPSKQPNPPLSARTALTKAKAFMAAILPDEHAKWTRVSLELSDTLTNGRWVWHVVYELHEPRIGGIVFTGVPYQMHCWVLLDGTVIQPTISDEKPENQ